MDATPLILGAMLIFSVIVSVVGFAYIARLHREDEAIDAATFLALRQLEE